MTDAQDPQWVIARLQDDLRGEHAAIVQYLQHVFKMEEMPDLGEIACEVEEIAREEMRHFKWLSETIVELGGVPTLDRDPIYINGSPPPGLMQLDIEAEDRAITLYEKHLTEIASPKITALIRRILSDERAHREDFVNYIQEMEGQPSSGAVPAQGPFEEAEVASAPVEAQKPPGEDSSGAQARPRVHETISLLNDDIVGQYATVLRYLLQSFLTSNCPVSKDLLEDRAQWEMKHWGWLAEKIVELGGEPSTEKPEVVVSHDTAAMLEGNIRAEQETVTTYQRHVAAIDDPEIKKLLERIVYDKAYDEEKLKEMLEALNREVTAQPAAALSAAASEQSGKSKPGGEFTVGSLIDKSKDKR